MRVVLDTNILISGLITSASPSSQVLALWRARRFDLLTSAQQLEEFARATRYPQVRKRLRPAVAGALLNQIRDRALVIHNLPMLDVAPDPDATICWRCRLLGKLSSWSAATNRCSV